MRFGFCHQLLLKLASATGRETKKKEDSVTIFYIFKFVKLLKI